MTTSTSRASRCLLTGMLLLIVGRVGAVMATELIAPAISIAGIHSPTLSMEGAQLICSVRVENPNDVALPLTGADVNLKLAGAPAARGRLLEPISIPARGRRDVDLLDDLDTASAVTWLPIFLDDQAFTVPFDVAGHVDVDHPDLGRVPFHETGDVSMTDAGLEATPSG